MLQGIETNLDPLRIGSDVNYAITVYTNPETRTTIRDITGFALSWMLKRRLSDADSAALITKTTTVGGIVIDGVFNASPAVNTQVAIVDIDDTDTDGMPEQTCYWELKRMDAGLESPIAFGRVSLRLGVHRT